MVIELHFVRRCGVKIPDRDAAAVPPLIGQLEMRNRWVSETRTLPALELSKRESSNGTGVLAVLYEPRLVGLNSNWVRFTGFEVLCLGEEKQLVVQDWRCYVLQ